MWNQLILFNWSIIILQYNVSFCCIDNFIIEQSEYPECLQVARKQSQSCRGTRGKEPTGQCRRLKRRRFNRLVRKIPWRRKWQLTLVILLGESHGQRSLVGYGPQGHKESDTTEVTLYTHTNTHIPASPMAQWVKNLPAMQETEETQVWSLGWGGHVVGEMTTHSSVLA